MLPHCTKCRDSILTLLECVLVVTQAQLMASLASTDEWCEAVSMAVGGMSGEPLNPASAAAEVKKLRAAAEKMVHEPGAVNVHKEAAKQLQLAQRNLENVVLRRQAHNAQCYAFPSTAQVSLNNQYGHTMECTYSSMI
jgi:hypothetical protein